MVLVRQMNSHTLSSCTRVICGVPTPMRTSSSNSMAVAARVVGGDCTPLGRIASDVAPSTNLRCPALTLVSSRRFRSGTTALLPVLDGIWTKWWWPTLWEDTGSLGQQQLTSTQERKWRQSQRAGRQPGLFCRAAQEYPVRWRVAATIAVTSRSP